MHMRPCLRKTISIILFFGRFVFLFVLLFKERKERKKKVESKTETKQRKQNTALAYSFYPSGFALKMFHVHETVLDEAGSES